VPSREHFEYTLLVFSGFHLRWSCRELDYMDNEKALKYDEYYPHTVPRPPEIFFSNGHLPLSDHGWAKLCRLWNYLVTKYNVRELGTN